MFIQNHLNPFCFNTIGHNMAKLVGIVLPCLHKNKQVSIFQLEKLYGRNKDAKDFIAQLTKGRLALFYGFSS